MSIVNMKLISIIGFINELDSVSSLCALSHAFEPDNVDLFYNDADKFSNFSESEVNKSSYLIKKLTDLSEKLSKKIEISNHPSSLNKKQISKHISEFSTKCDKAFSKLDKLNHKLKENNKIISELKPFEKVKQKFDDFKNCKYIITKFVKISSSSLQKLNTLENKDDKLIINEISKVGEYSYCVLLVSEEFQSEIESTLVKVQAREFFISNLNSTPEEEIDMLKDENKIIESNIKKVKEGINKFWEHQKKHISEIFVKLKNYEKIGKIKKFAKVYKENFILVGWIPESNVRELTDKLKKISRIEYSVEAGDELLKFSPPTKLKNKKIFSPFEFFISTYGLPKNSDIDPTPFLAITYTIIFGIMFADIGQGLMLSLIGLFLTKVKNMKLGGVMSICGLSSSVFGFIFGSIFGFENALEPLYKAINFHPIRVMESPMLIIVSSIAIGVISIILAMIVNIYSRARKKDYNEAIFSHSGLCGIALYSSLVALLVTTFSSSNSSLINSLLILSICTFIILIFLKEAIKNKFKVSWGDYFLSQFFELFEILLGYFTNTISFVRIGVFVFVHVGMMMVVFSLADGQSPFMYAFIVILGNIIVSCLEAFLVGMQVMRLQFCELFGRFFEGGGREFKPITNL